MPKLASYTLVSHTDGFNYTFDVTADDGSTDHVGPLNLGVFVDEPDGTTAQAQLETALLDYMDAYYRGKALEAAAVAVAPSVAALLNVCRAVA